MNSRLHILYRQIFTPGTSPLLKLPASMRIQVNSAWLLLARIVVQFQTVLLTVLVARRLGEAAFGQYSLIASLIFLGNVLTTFGTDTLLIRQVARAGNTDIPEVRAALHIQVAFSALTVAAIWMWTAGHIQASPEGFITLRLYSLSLFPLAFFSVFSSILRGLERMDLALLASLGTAGMQLVAVWLALQARSGLTGLMEALLAVQVFAMAFCYFLLKVAAPAFTFHLNVEVQILARLLRAAWPLAALSVLGVAYQRLGVFALSSLGSDAQTGLYSAAARVIEALKLGHIAVLGALLPALARLQEQPGKAREARRLFRNTAWGLLGLGLFGAAGAFLLAGPLVNLLYGARYVTAIPALRTLAWLLLPYSLSSAFAVEMVAKKREKRVMIALGISLLAAAGLNLWWIPLWGVEGAGVAAVAAEVVQVGVLWRIR